MTSTLPEAGTAGASTAEEYAVLAATAVAGVLPSVQPLTAAGAQPGSPHVTSAFAGAVLATLEGPVSGRIGLLVAADLVEALAASPIQGLDLAAAAQPALDAAAAVLGGAAQAARTVDLGGVVDELAGAFTVVPLIGAGIAAAVLLPDTTLAAAVAAGTGGTGGIAGATATGAFPAAEQGGSPVGQQAGSPADQPMGQPMGQPVTQPIAQPVPAPVFGAAPVGATPGIAPQRGIEMLHGVVMDVTVEIGRTRMTVRDLLALSPGTVLELDRAAGSPADLLVNGRLVARGEVVVVDEDFGLRVTEIVDDSAV
ncbi:MAG: flagellar motor switch protein FliN [Marmoricola sp.]